MTSPHNKRKYLESKISDLENKLKLLKTMMTMSYDDRCYAIKQLKKDAPWMDRSEIVWREQRAFRNATDTDDYDQRLEGLEELFKQMKPNRDGYKSALHVASEEAGQDSPGGIKKWRVYFRAACQ